MDPSARINADLRANAYLARQESQRAVLRLLERYSAANESPVSRRVFETVTDGPGRGNRRFQLSDPWPDFPAKPR